MLPLINSGRLAKLLPILHIAMETGLYHLHFLCSLAYSL